MQRTLFGSSHGFCRIFEVLSSSLLVCISFFAVVLRPARSPVFPPCIRARGGGSPGVPHDVNGTPIKFEKALDDADDSDGGLVLEKNGKTLTLHGYNLDSVTAFERAMKREREEKNLCTAETYSPTIAPTKSDTELETLRKEMSDCSEPDIIDAYLNSTMAASLDRYRNEFHQYLQDLGLRHLISIPDDLIESAYAASLPFPELVVNLTDTDTEDLRLEPNDDGHLCPPLDHQVAALSNPCSDAPRMETPKNDLNVIQSRILPYGNSTAPFGRQDGAH